MSKKPKTIRIKKLIDQLQTYHSKYGNIPILLNLATVDHSIIEDCSLSSDLKFKLTKVVVGPNPFDDDAVESAVVIHCMDEFPGEPFEF